MNVITQLRNKGLPRQRSLSNLFRIILFLLFEEEWGTVDWDKELKSIKIREMDERWIIQILVLIFEDMLHVETILLKTIM